MFKCSNKPVDMCWARFEFPRYLILSATGLRFKSFVDINLKLLLLVLTAKILQEARKTYRFSEMKTA